MVEGWTVDVRQWGDALIYAFAVSGAIFGLWKMWLKNIVEWVRQQGETNTTVAKVITEELPKMTRAIEHVTDTQRDHGKRIAEVEGRVADLEGGAISGASPRASGAYMNQPKRRRRAAE